MSDDERVEGRDSSGVLFTEEMVRRCIDPTLPPDVVVLRRDDGVEVRIHLSEWPND